jgi:hypothetical protein
MVFAVRCTCAVVGTFLARVVNRSLWQCLLAVMRRLVEWGQGLAKGLLELGEGVATLGEVNGLLTAVAEILDEALVTAVEETESPVEVRLILEEGLR